jgi:hypothetical protein
MQRLLWLSDATWGVRFRAFAEFWQLSRINYKIGRPTGFADELRYSLVGTIGKAENSANLSASEEQEIIRWLEPLSLAMRVHRRAACCEKALRMMQILRKQGVRPDSLKLRIGVRRAPVGFRGHCWVEFNGGELLDSITSACEYEYIWDGMEIVTLLEHQSCTNQTSELSSGRRLAFKDTVLMRELSEGEAVILDIKSGLCFGLYGAGCDIWQEITRNGSVDRLLVPNKLDPDNDLGCTEQEVVDFVAELIAAGLLVSYGAANCVSDLHKSGG